MEDVEGLKVIPTKQNPNTRFVSNFVHLLGTAMILQK